MLPRYMLSAYTRQGCKPEKQKEFHDFLRDSLSINLWWKLVSPDNIVNILYVRIVVFFDLAALLHDLDTEISQECVQTSSQQAFGWQEFYFFYVFKAKLFEKFSGHNKICGGTKTLWRHKINLWGHCPRMPPLRGYRPEPECVKAQHVA